MLKSTFPFATAFIYINESHNKDKVDSRMKKQNRKAKILVKSIILPVESDGTRYLKLGVETKITNCRGSRVDDFIGLTV